MARAKYIRVVMEGNKKRMKKYLIVPRATLIEINAESEAEALERFAIEMDSDMDTYFKAVLAKEREDVNQTNYASILNGLKEFYAVNDELQNSLENYSKDNTGRSLDENLELFAKNNADSVHAKIIIDELEYLNNEPHSISEMEMMYELIDDFALLKN